MGTTCTHKPKGTSVADFFLEHGVLRWGDDNPHTYKVLATALVNLTEFYAAVEMTHKETGERRVWAAVIKVTFVRTPRVSRYRDGWEHNFCYKDMDESMGPVQNNCPERILKLLTPTEYDYAKSWRTECWAKIEAKKARPKIKPGTHLLYGGRVFQAEESLGQRGWRVHDVEYPNIYRLKRSQVAASEILCQA